jgi:hypothetical protein
MAKSEAVNFVKLWESKDPSVSVDELAIVKAQLMHKRQQRYGLVEA